MQSLSDIEPICLLNYLGLCAKKGSQTSQHDICMQPPPPPRLMGIMEDCCHKPCNCLFVTQAENISLKTTSQQLVKYSVWFHTALNILNIYYKLFSTADNFLTYSFYLVSRSWQRWGEIFLHRVLAHLIKSLSIPLLYTVCKN